MALRARLRARREAREGAERTAFVRTVLARNAAEDEALTVAEVLARYAAADGPVYPRMHGRRTVVREGRLWAMW